MRSGVKAPVSASAVGPTSAEGQLMRSLSALKPSRGESENNSESDLEIESPVKLRPQNEDSINYSDDLNP